MPSVVYRLRAELRHGWRALVVIAVLVGLSGGAAMASLAAARRTDTAFERMRSATDAWDIEINPNNGGASRLSLEKLRKLPGVERIGRVDGLALYVSLAKSVPDAFNLPPVIVSDRDATYSVGRPLMVAGRQPAADDPNGVWIDRTFAQERHLRVGQRFHYVLLSDAIMQKLQTAGTPAEAHQILYGAPASMQGDARIDGIGMTQDGIVVDPGYVPASFLFTPAFYRAHPDMQIAYWGALVKLAPGTDVDAFAARVRALVPDESIAFQRASAVTAEVTNATDPEVMALEAFAVLAALLGLVVVAQALSRRMQLDARSNATLTSMGATRLELMAVSMAKALLAVVVGATLAVGVAVAASPLGPVGAVRQPRCTRAWRSTARCCCSVGSPSSWSAARWPPCRHGAALGCWPSVRSAPGPASPRRWRRRGDRWPRWWGSGSDSSLVPDGRRCRCAPRCWPRRPRWPW